MTEREFLKLVVMLVGETPSYVTFVDTRYQLVGNHPSKFSLPIIDEFGKTLACDVVSASQNVVINTDAL